MTWRCEGKHVTEAEWLAQTDPTSLLNFLWGQAGDRLRSLFAAKAGDRKMRLFGVACCLRVAHLTAGPPQMNTPQPGNATSTPPSEVPCPNRGVGSPGTMRPI